MEHKAVSNAFSLSRKFHREGRPRYKVQIFGRRVIEIGTGKKILAQQRGSANGNRKTPLCLSDTDPMVDENVFV